MEVKICGITKEIETEYLNEAMPDYAGFVFFEKSKRNVSINQAKQLMEKLDKRIKRVAVMVSPDTEFIKEIQTIGVDFLQIHKELKTEVLQAAELPIWYAMNIEDETQAEKQLKFFDELPEELSKKITAIVADAPSFGSGKPFNWSKSKRLKKAGTNSPPDTRAFILAGGLRPENVAEGIEIFSPDVVDVSSGVEGEAGKDRELILKFIAAARNSN